MKKVVAAVASISFLLIAILFCSAGLFFDISQKPIKADAIGVLGGDWEGYRVKKALSLYRQRYADKIIINENSKIDVKTVDGKTAKTELEFLLLSNVPSKNILLMKNAGNTMYELKSLEKILFEKGFHSILIVSAPPHLRRIKILAEKAAEFPQKGINVIYVSSDPPWWNPYRWFLNKTARNFVIGEVVKTTSNYIAYVILEKNDLLEPAREYIGPIIEKIKKFFQTLLRKLDTL